LYFRKFSDIFHVSASSLSRWRMLSAIYFLLGDKMLGFYSHSIRGRIHNEVKESEPKMESISGKEEESPPPVISPTHWLTLSLSLIEMSSLFSSLLIPPNEWKNHIRPKSSLSLSSSRVAKEKRGREGGRGGGVFGDEADECVALNAPNEAPNLSIKRKVECDRTFSDIQLLMVRLSLTSSLELFRLSLLTHSSDCVTFSDIPQWKGRVDVGERERVCPSVHTLWTAIQVTQMTLERCIFGYFGYL
jgi:hypothetical protein